MRSALIVIDPPALDLLACFGQRHEPVDVQTLVPERAVEGLDVGVVGWGRGSGEVEADLVALGREIDDLTGELRVTGSGPKAGCF